MHDKTKKWLFTSKDNYEEVLKYHEGPPCNNCFVLPMCFNSTIDDDNYYEIVLNKPCDEANKWFMLAEYLDDFIDSFMRLPGGLLTIEDIKNMNELGDIIDLENQMGLKLPNKSIASDFRYFEGFLFELLSITYKDEIMQDFIIPFMEDQSKLLEERKKQDIFFG